MTCKGNVTKVMGDDQIFFNEGFISKQQSNRKLKSALLTVLSRPATCASYAEIQFKQRWDGLNDLLSEEEEHKVRQN